MVVRDVGRIIESIAPPGLAWERDNVGLLVGSPSARVRGIVVALDATDRVIDEARRRKVNMIVVHHPLIWDRLGRVSDDDRVGGLVMRLVRERISLWSAHTNLDFASGGVNDVLAGALGLKDRRFLRPALRRRRKIVVFVPAESADAVARAMSAAGAGTIGAYTECSFRSTGTGTFFGGKGASPAAGRAGKLESVAEIRLEMILPAERTDDVVAAMLRVHPYEEAAFDLYDVVGNTIETGRAQARSTGDHAEPDASGEGVIGTLRRPMKRDAFLRMVARSLGSSSLRYSGPDRSVSVVAVCGGAGGELASEARSAGADAFVTADVRYHDFQPHAGEMLLVDAGHFETEAPVVGALARRLGADPAIRRANIRVHASKRMENPVRYFR